MMTRGIETFLANDQIARGLRRFMAHHPRHFAVTGSITREVRLGLLGVDPAERTVGDVDLVVEGAGSLPGSLATDFLCPHVHPAAPAGGVLIQLVHPQDAVRFDVFKAADGALARSSAIPFGAFSVPVLSLEDLYAKSVALIMKLGRGGTVAAKHADDFNRLRGHADPILVEQAWRSYVNSFLLFMLAGAMMLPALADLAVRNPDGWVFIVSSATTLFFGGMLYLGNRGFAAAINRRTGFALTVSCWLFIGAFSTLPLLYSSLELLLVDAYFETMSGLTTTGSTVIVGLDELCVCSTGEAQ